MYGLPVNVLRSEYDCTVGGLTSRVNRCWLITDDPNHLEIKDETDLLQLKKQVIGGSLYLRAVPVQAPQDAAQRRGPMMGGNFIWSSDSRFREINEYPIPVHDRWEYPLYL